MPVALAKPIMTGRMKPVVRSTVPMKPTTPESSGAWVNTVPAVPSTWIQ